MQKNNYTAVNLENLCSIIDITGTQAKIFNYMMLNMDYSNYFYFAGWQKDHFCQKYEVARQTLNNNISQMMKKNMIRAIGRDEFLINKDYAIKGIPKEAMRKETLNPLEDLYDFADNLNKRKGYVYAIGFFDSFDKARIDISKAFYIGKSCSVLTDRLSSHEKRQKGSKAMFIEFGSYDEAGYAEKVLINFLKPDRNKEVYCNYQNEEYAKILIGRSWALGKSYNTGSNTEKKRTATIYIDEDTGLINAVGINDKVEVD
tara:strand:+ start:985 stop:1761 length:777 start_codon:yes stop_codon:yes gene_type:complete